MTPQERAEDLILNGYQEVTELGALKVGQRVRHYSEQWSGAYEKGTATIARIFHHPNSSWSQAYNAKDVELIVTRDDGSSGYWANYHTETLRSEEP